MLRVGLTGGIGSGKSTVARVLMERGALLIDSDELARDVVAPGTEGLALIRDRFGDSVIGADGSLDRPTLGRIAFGDESARSDLNAIVHPRVLAETRARMARAAEDAVVVHDIPLLVELGREADYHLVVVVAAGEDVRLRRLIDDRGMGEADARARIAAQATDQERRAAADVWLPNEGDLEELTARVDRLWRDRLVPFEHNLRTRTPVSRESTVRLVDPDPDWATTAARLLGRLHKHLTDAGMEERVRGLEHIGSTAVPRLIAKDVIDLQLTVDDLSLATTPVFENALLAAGFAPSRCRRQTEDQANVDSIHPFAPDPHEWVTVTYGSCDPQRVAHVHVRARRLR